MNWAFFNRKPYKGGPHFERLSTHCFDLGGTGLELTTPASDFVVKEPPRMLNFPFQNAGWFDANCKRGKLHAELSVFCEIWSYFPAGVKRITNLVAMGSNERMGGFSITVQLNRVENEQQLVLGDAGSLGAYMSWEHSRYYDFVREESACRWKHGQPGQTESDRQMYKSSLETYIKPLPKFGTASFGGVQWMHYNVQQGWAVTTDHYYLALSDKYYVCIELEFRFEVADRNRTVLEPEMQKTADWLLQHVKITRPGVVPETRALPPA